MDIIQSGYESEVAGWLVWVIDIGYIFTSKHSEEPDKTSAFLGVVEKRTTQSSIFPLEEEGDRCAETCKYI